MSTVARQQYLHIKSQYPDAVLLYQVGDFYETYDEDAHIASRVLEIVLTKKCIKMTIKCRWPAYLCACWTITWAN